MLKWLKREHDNPELELSFFEHLDELRSRLFWSVLAIIVCACLGFVYAREIIAFLMGPLRHATSGLAMKPDLHFTSLTEPLFQSLKIALFTGISLAFPFWIWQVWRFVAPGLFENEKRLVGPFLSTATGLFVLGAAFAYWLAIPTAYRFLLIYANPHQTQSAPAHSTGLVFSWHEKDEKQAGKSQKQPSTQGRKQPPALRKRAPGVPPRPTRVRPVGPQAPTRSAKASTRPVSLPTSRAVRPSSLPALRPKGPARKAQVARLRPTPRRAAPKRALMAPGQRRLRVHLPPSALGSPEDLLTHLKKQKTLSVSFETKQRTKQFVVQLQWPTKKQKDILGDLKPILTLQSYISVSSWFLLGFGLVFQTPMVIFLLVFIGIVTPDLLARYRRHAFVAILIISSILTPTGDPVNLMIMAIPMYILFEIGLWVSRVLITNPRERAAGTPSGDDGGGGSPPTTPWTTPPPDSTPPAEGQETSTPPASDASATLLSQEADVSEGETEVPKAEESAVEDSNVQEEGASEASTTAQESDRVDQSADRGEEASDERDEGPMEESAGAGEREPEPLPTIRPPEGTVSQIPMHQRVQSASQDEEETDKEQEETGTDQEEEDKPRG